MTKWEKQEKEKFVNQATFWMQYFPANSCTYQQLVNQTKDVQTSIRTEIAYQKMEKRRFDQMANYREDYFQYLEEWE